MEKTGLLELDNAAPMARTLRELIKNEPVEMQIAILGRALGETIAEYSWLTGRIDPHTAVTAGSDILAGTIHLHLQHLKKTNREKAWKW